MTESQTAELLIPLINIYRKFEALTPSQSSALSTPLYDLFEKYNQQALFIQIFKHGLCPHYSSISPSLYKEIDVPLR